jgi:hypothetical protein
MSVYVFLVLSGANLKKQYPMQIEGKPNIKAPAILNFISVNKKIENMPLNMSNVPPIYLSNIAMTVAGRVARRLNARYQYTAGPFVKDNDIHIFRLIQQCITPRIPPIVANIGVIVSLLFLLIAFLALSAVAFVSATISASSVCFICFCSSPDSLCAHSNCLA